ncbi:hypothetical protein P171DRAFT_50625 [Karstenula rhodostoma CBS 690.94]|uniref:Uncharacterized protein n=1 Tax=Karstenula rhodostoma CBS 690.94 TaxID=1392251 RepID=A0A9P4PGP3_9PLEO|nr:hypothetical protein P171DRAFT_50625 [Karstenula rhodostoma CBS 690.94]
MPPDASASDNRPPINQATMTSERGKPETDATCPLRPGSEIEQSARPSLPPTKPKLKLRSTPAEPTPESTAPRRSGRIVMTAAKHGKDPARNGALLAETKPREKKSLRGKSTDSPGVGASRPPHEFAKRVTGHPNGDSPSNAGGSIAREKRGGSSLYINPGNINDPIDVDALPSPPPHQLENRAANYYVPFPLQYRPSRPNIPPTLFRPNGAEIQVSGHQSHDIYRSYIGLKDAPAPPGFAISCAKLSAEVSTGRPHSRGPNPFPHMHSAHMNGYGHSHGVIVSQPAQDFSAHGTTYDSIPAVE